MMAEWIFTNTILVILLGLVVYSIVKKCDCDDDE